MARSRQPKQLCKALDIVKCDDGKFGMIIQTKSHGSHATIRFFDEDNYNGETLWTEFKLFTVINSFPALMAHAMDYGYGTKCDNSRVFSE